MRSEVVLLCLSFAIIASSQGIATLSLLKEASEKYGAVCLDGTPSAYYISHGTGDGATKWLLFHQGGGWCTSFGDCYSRSLTALGSSKSYAPTTKFGGGYFSSEATVNPLMYNWNMVNFQYCDGGSFAGNNETVSDYQGHHLYFRGLRNLQAYLDDLSTNHGLMMGTEFVISGCSAGGLATYLHVDWWKENLPKGAIVKGMPDSGFFLDYDSTIAGGPHYSTDMKWVFQAMNATSGVNQACISAHTPTKDTNLCFFAEHTSPHITTPIFPLQSQYDSWQTGNILGSSNATLINTYGQTVSARFKMAVLSEPRNGCFFDSCFHHCGAWDSIVIGGSNVAVASKLWYQGGKEVDVQSEVYPCDMCCKAKLRFPMF